MIQKPILYILIFSLLLILGLVLIWAPQYRNFNDLRFQVNKKNKELQNKEAYFSQLETLSSQLKEPALEMAKIESALPSLSHVPDVLNFIERIGGQSGLVLQKVDIGKIQLVEEESALTKTVLSVSLSGAYPAFKNFLSELQNSARLIGVEEISFTSPVAGDIFSFALKIRTYSY